MGQVFMNGISGGGTQVVHGQFTPSSNTNEFLTNLPFEPDYFAFSLDMSPHGNYALGSYAISGTYIKEQNPGYVRTVSPSTTAGGINRRDNAISGMWGGSITLGPDSNSGASCYLKKDHTYQWVAIKY